MNADSVGLPRKPGMAGALLQAVLVVIIVASSLALGSLAQEIPLRYLLLALLLIGGWAAYAVLFGVTLQNTLPLITLFFLKPLELGFYLILILLVFTGMVEYLRKAELKLLIPYPLAAMVLLFFGILSAIKINVPMGYTYFFSAIIAPLLILTLFSNVSVDRVSLFRWMQSVVYVAMIVGLYGIVIAILNPFERLGSFWVTAMTINGFYTAAFFFAVTLALYHTSRISKAFNALAALIIFFGMLYTYTRIVILAVAFGMFLFMLRLKVMRYFGLGFLLLLPLVIPSSMTSRIQMGFNIDISLVIRALAWYLSVAQIIKHPIFGMGFSVWSTWYPHVIPLKMLYAQHSHNVYLNLMVEMGIIGTAAYFYLIWKVLRNFWKRCIAQTQDILTYGMWVSMLALLFACITDIFIEQFSVSILFWISLGLMLSLSNRKENDEQLR